MRIIDLSQPLFDNAPNCPVHPPVKIDITSRHPANEPANPDTWHMEQLSFASHTGSHVDAPLHKIPNGRPIDAFPLSAWTGPAHILDLRPLTHDAAISIAQIEARISPQAIAHHWILLATGWGGGDKRAKTSEWLHHSPTLSHEASEYLVRHNAQGVGIDPFSIGDATTHAILLSKPVLIVEELHFPEEVFTLHQIPEFMALPINLKNHSGAPCRPVLILR